VCRSQPLLSFHSDFGEKDVAAVPKELLVVQLTGLAAGFGVSVCATVGDWLFTGSPLRKASACRSWKSSFEPSSVGLTSARSGTGLVRVEGLDGLVPGAASFFSGTRPPSELPAFLALADVLVSPRVKGENTPFKIYSYLASGRPIVATRIPTHTQLLDDSLAFLVEPTSEALAAGLRQALEQKDDARGRADRGLALVEREYSVERYREKIARAYKEVDRRVRGASGGPA